MNDKSYTFPAELCLLCRCKHEETSCVDIEVKESCSASSYNSTSPVSSSWICLSSSTSSVPLPSSHDEYSSSRLHNNCSMHSRPRRSHSAGLLGSKLLWMFTFTAIIVLSSAASLAHRNTNVAHQKASIGLDKVQDLDTAVIDEYLENFGYYHHKKHHKALDSNKDVPALGPALPEELHRQHTQQEREEALKRMQEFFHISGTGYADEETKSLMDAKRCGVKDIIEDDDDDDDDDEGSDVIESNNNGAEQQGNFVSEREITITFPEKKRRRKRYAVARYSNGRVNKWQTNHLTWKLVGPSSQLSEQQQRETIRRAIALWGKVIPIQFTEETGVDEADIRFLFGRLRHGPSPDPVFDGRQAHQNTLAHAWGPHVSPKGLPGDVHFDEDDDFSITDELFIVAAHELGHSFGLLHSEDRASIMYPVYQNLPRLGQDDLDAVDYLYGPNSDQSWRSTKAPWTRQGRTNSRRQHFTVRPEWVTRPPPQGVDTCGDVIVNAFLPDPSPENKNFFIAVSGDRVHRLSPTGEIIQSDSLQNVFPDLPESPDVGLSVVKEQTIFFIKGEKMWAYKEGSLMEGFPRSISSMNFPEKPQYSISLQDRDGNDRPLLFGKSYWWMFDSQGYNVARYDSIRTFSRDLPDDILFVAQWSDRRLYAVTNNSYVVLDSIQRSKTHEKPIIGKPDWLSPLCEEIKGPASESGSTVTIVLVVLVICCALIGLGTFVFFKLRKNYKAYI